LSSFAKPSSAAIHGNNELTRDTASAPPLGSRNTSTPRFTSLPKSNDISPQEMERAETLAQNEPNGLFSITHQGPMVDWWKGGLSLSDELLLQQLAELKRAKTYEAEERMSKATEAHDASSQALEDEKKRLILRLEAMKAVVQAMERDVEDVKARIALNDAELEQKITECLAAKRRYSFL
jgi:hypothetical protein